MCSAGRNWGEEEKGTAEDKMAGWHHWLNGHEFEWTPGVGDGQGGLACCNSWVTKSWTQLSDWTELNWCHLPIAFLGIYPQVRKTYSHTHTNSTGIFIAILIKIAKNYKQCICPSKSEWLNKLWYVYTVEHYSAIKRNPKLVHIINYMNPQRIMLS